MFQLVYLSTEAVAFDAAQLLALQTESEQANRQRDITGMLLYRDGFFLQALEGSREAVGALMDRIQKDSRHKALLVLLAGAVVERDFASWSMGFRDLSGTAFQSVAGLSFDPARTSPSLAKRLLRTFREEGATAPRRA